MPNYKKGLIYKITTPGWLYVGSCCDFKEREIKHRSCIKNNNYKLYQNIRENNGKWKMEKIKDFPCENVTELRKEEDKIMLELNADLNERRAHTSVEEKKEQRKEYRQANKEQIKERDKEYKKIYREANKEKLNQKNRIYYQTIKDQRCEIVTCDCGCKITRGAITRHRKTQKHLRLMENIKI